MNVVVIWIFIPIVTLFECAFFSHIFQIVKLFVFFFNDFGVFFSFVAFLMIKLFLRNFLQRFSVFLITRPSIIYSKQNLVLLNEL